MGLLFALNIYVIIILLQNSIVNINAFSTNRIHRLQNDLYIKLNNYLSFHRKLIRVTRLNAKSNDVNNDLNNHDTKKSKDNIDSPFSSSSSSSSSREERTWELAYEDDDPRLYRLKGNKNMPQMPKGMNPYMSAKEQKMYDEMMAAENKKKLDGSDALPKKSDLEILKESLKKMGERMDEDFKSPKDRDPLEGI